MTVGIFCPVVHVALLEVPCYFFFKFPNVYFESITGHTYTLFLQQYLQAYSSSCKTKSHKQTNNKQTSYEKNHINKLITELAIFNKKETIEHRQTHVVTRQQRRRERLRQRRRRPGRRRRHQTAGEAPSLCSFPRRSSWRLAKTDTDGATPPNRGAAARLSPNRHLQISRSGGRQG